MSLHHGAGLLACPGAEQRGVVGRPVRVARFALDLGWGRGKAFVTWQVG